jgi:FKBP-type peptidyl-prolyl cis-trans isomerase FkpA
MRLGLLAAVLLALTGLQANAQELKSEDDKTVYALGLSLGRTIKIFDLSPAEIEIVKKGMTDALTGATPAVDLEQYGRRLTPLANSRQERAGQKFLETAAKEKGATKLPSGVVYKELKAGTGASPKASDKVRVHYRGTLINGAEFDSSYKGDPVEFGLTEVIQCWTEGVQKMKVGGKAQLVCPAKTGYGATGSPPRIPSNATLVFDIELLGIGGQGADVPRADPQPKK